MDKGLDRIKILATELDAELEKFYNILTEKNKKNNESNSLRDEERTLKNINSNLISDKNDIIYYMENMKKWKKNKIIYTILGILILEITSIVSNLIAFDVKEALAFILFTNILIIPVSIYYGDVNDYRGAKKYLKKNKLEDVEKELEKNQYQLNLNREKQNTIENEIINLEMNEKILEASIQNLRLEIEKINNIRKDIINNYITDNKELNRLLDSGYMMYEEENKEKTKQLIKE